MPQTTYEYTKSVSALKLKQEIAALDLATPLTQIDTVGTTVYVRFPSALSNDDKTALDTCLADHVAITTAESFDAYLNASVFPFVNSMIRTFAAENIANGITQAGKTADVLALFTTQFPVGASLAAVSFKDCCDTGSLYSAREVLIYVRANPNTYAGLSPFVTDARLLAMLHRLENFLGITPLST